MKTAIRTLLRFYRLHAVVLAVDVVCRLARSGLLLVIPMVALKVFQETLPAHDLGATGRCALAFALLALLSAALDCAATLCGQHLGFVIEAEMRAKLFDHLEKLPFAYFDRNRTGAILSRITGDLRQLGSAVHLLPESLVEIVLTLVGAFAVMFCLNPKLAAVTLIPVPFVLLFAGSFQQKLHGVWRGNRRDAAEFSAHVENAIEGIREIKSFTAEARTRKSFSVVNRRYLNSFIAMSHLFAPLNAGTQLLLEGYSLLYIGIGAYMAAKGSATVGEVFAFYMYSRYVTMPMMRVVNFLDLFQQGIVGCRRYCELMDEKEEPEDPPSADRKAVVSGDIRLEGVRFRYEGRDEDVLDIPELVIPAGTRCAFVGPSGGGKSTIAALLPRFYEVTGGRISIGGADTAHIAKAALRRSIGLVAQRPFLFTGTIRDNLLLGRSDADDEALWRALAQVSLGDFVRGLPEGLATEVGERGVKLSGGQAQRLAIARVFLKNPKILILDEATSALDTFSEAAVQAALRELTVGRTTVVIAHRLTTIRDATMICYLEGGRIVESGTHAELMARHGRYEALLRLSQTRN